MLNFCTAKGRSLWISMKCGRKLRRRLTGLQGPTKASLPSQLTWESTPQTVMTTLFYSTSHALTCWPIQSHCSWCMLRFIMLQYTANTLYTAGIYSYNVTHSGKRFVSNQNGEVISICQVFNLPDKPQKETTPTLGILSINNFPIKFD